MPLHSIIIPHRNRNANLELCVWSLARSWGYTLARMDLEILVVDAGSKQCPACWNGEPVRVVLSPQQGTFNKSRLLNVGIEHAKGEVLTFLDADAVVGKRFLDNALRLLHDPTLTKYCYRVSTLSPESAEQLRRAVVGRDLLCDTFFERFNESTLAFEAYGEPHRNGRFAQMDGPVFGNSQFSIRRDVLGDVRCDETFTGPGYEDIHFNFLIWKRHYDTYRAEMITEPDFSIFHIASPDGKARADWQGKGCNEHNRQRYLYQLGRFRRELNQKESQANRRSDHAKARA